MSLFRKFILWFFVAVVLIFLVVYAAVRVSGRQALEDNLSAALKRPVTIKEVRFIFPVGLRADGVDIEGFLTTETMRAHFGVSALFGKGLVFSKVVLEKPRLSLQKNKDGVWQLGKKVKFDEPDEKPKKFLFFSAPETKSEQTQTDQAASTQTPLGMMIEYLWITDGRLTYTDKTLPEPLTVQMEDLSIRAYSVSYPLRPFNIRYNLTANVVSEGLPYSGSKLESNGRINWVQRGMNAKVKLTEPNGSVVLDADIVSENNRLTGKGRFKLSHLVSSTPQKSGKPKKDDGNSFEEFFVTALNSSGLQAKAECEFETQMDDFSLDKLSCKGKVGINQAGLKENLQEIGKKFEDIGKQLIEPKAGPVIDQTTPAQQNSVAE